MMTLARGLILLGVLLILIGGAIYLAGRIGLPLGRLPGDIKFEGQNISCFFPLATMILLSVILTVVLNVVIRWLNK